MVQRRTGPDAQTMSSLEIAELTGKKHHNVMADVRKMLESLEKLATDFSVTRIDGRGKEQKMFALDRFHTEVLVTGYDVKRRAAVIQRWYDLESGEATPWYQQKAEPETPQLPDFTNPAEASPTPARPRPAVIRPGQPVVDELRADQRMTVSRVRSRHPSRNRPLLQYGKRYSASPNCRSNGAAH